jgi:hypothetical protein
MRRLFLVLALLGGLGCGYRLAGESAHVPATAQTLSIRLWENHTREHGLEVQLRRALEQEFRRRGVLRIVPDPEGDLVLTGQIKRFASVPVAFSGTDEALQYQGVIHVSFRLLERASKRVIHTSPSLVETQDFGAVSGVVIASSPHFQRGTMDARDLANLTSVQLGETRRREALRDLLDRLAEDVYLRAMEDF